MEHDIPKDTPKDDSKPYKKPETKTERKKIKKTKRFILLKYKLNANIGGYGAGSVVGISCHRKTKVPKERYWRSRLRDAAVDNCMELYTETGN